MIRGGPRGSTTQVTGVRPGGADLPPLPVPLGGLRGQEGGRGRQVQPTADLPLDEEGPPRSK